MLDLNLAHQDQSEGLRLRGKVLAAPLLGRSYTVHLPVVGMPKPLKRANAHALLVEDVEVPHCNGSTLP
jgi:hypothetical protein